ncbi:hypothetical protein F4808DRAFT_407804 [Astrocystis sublimbata]|nr:hypothetical protein F4808DRAFT_407804 [Astrocystis sublimbata]
MTSYAGYTNLTILPRSSTSPQPNTDSAITQATVFTSTCAQLLFKESGSRDIVFGRIISGRQGLPASWKYVVGPCTNEVPVRARLDRGTSQRALLREIQGQYLNSIPFENLGFDEIKKNCTDWLEEVTNFGCCIVYQNFNYYPDSQMHEARVQLGVLSRDNDAARKMSVYDLVIAEEADPEGHYLSVTVVASRGVCDDSDEQRAKRMVEELYERTHASGAISSPSNILEQAKVVTLPLKVSKHLNKDETIPSASPRGYIDKGLIASL